MRASKVLCWVVFFIITLVTTAFANETSFYDPGKQLIIRGYKDTSNTLILEVRNLDGSLAGNARINNGNNPTTVASNVSSFSIAYNTHEHKAYILHHAGNADQPTLSTFEISSSVVVSAPNIVANPTSIDYGTINIGESADRTITLKNTGTTNTNLGEVSLGSGPFSLIKEGTTCNNSQVLQPGAQCDIVVRFAPTTYGQFNDILSIGSISISLSGNGGGGSGGGGADVEFTRIDHNCWSNNEDMFVRVSLHNKGTEPTPNFTVTVSIQRNNNLYPEYPPMPERELTTLYVDIINPNETKIVEQSGIYFNGLPIHFEYFLIFRINLNDADNSNNIASSRCYLYR